MAATRPRAVRIAAGIGFVLLWVPVAILGIELAERARIELGNALFPRMLGPRMNQIYGMDFAPPAGPAAPHEPLLARDRVAAVTPATPPVPAADTDASLTAAGIARFTVTPAGTLEDAAGEPAFVLHARREWERYPQGSAAPAWIAHARSDRGDGTFEVSFAFAALVRHYRVTVYAADAAGRRHVAAQDLTASMPYDAIDTNPHRPPGSPWLAAFYAYRPGAPFGINDEHMNNFGFRDRPVTVPRPEGVYRIVCIGGSTTEEGATMETTYPRLVERHLQARFGPGVEVINAGVVGTTTFNIRTRIDHYLAMEPDLLLFYGGVNDISHHYMPIWLEARPDSVRRIERSMALRRWRNRDFLPPDDALRRFLEETTLRNLAAIDLRAREAGAALVVCSFATPDPARLRWRDGLFLDANLAATWGGQGLVHYRAWREAIVQLNEALAAWAAQPGGPALLPVADHFVGGAEYFADTCHVTAAGMEAKAAAIARLLGDHLAAHPGVGLETAEP